MAHIPTKALYVITLHQYNNIPTKLEQYHLETIQVVTTTLFAELYGSMLIDADYEIRLML